MVPTKYCSFFMPAFPALPRRRATTISFWFSSSLHAADQRNHDFRNDLDALLRHLHGGFENRARLHLGDLGIGDAQTAAAMAQHRIELVQLFHAMQQLRQTASSDSPTSMP